MDLSVVRDVAGRLREQVHRVVVGQDHAIDLLLVALLCEGHILFEGVPGVAKTLLARTFAGGLSLQFGRVQFTPDLMPGDIIGTNLFNFQTNSFTLTQGPIFTELLLADEINRTPPKTQAALLQAMQERAVTVDGTTLRARRRLHGDRDAEPDRAARAPIRCPRRSSTASCSRSSSAIRRATRSATSSPPRHRTAMPSSPSSASGRSPTSSLAAAMRRR